MIGRLPVFDLDGTLLDSDEALVAPFLALGVARQDVRFGEPVEVACRRLGVPTEAYVAAYDPAASQPFPGVDELLARLARWAVCSNKADASGAADLARWGWQPEVALFTSAFGGGPKRLAPVLERLGVGAQDVVFVGDSEHDRATAADAGCPFVVAAWNPRAADLQGDAVARHPLEVAGLLGLA